jgi:hypothetical protein
MATKTKPRAKTITAKGVSKLAEQTWVIPCGLLDDWDEPDSDYAPYVKRAVLDGYVLTYALLGEQDEASGERRASLALSFRPDPIKTIPNEMDSPPLQAAS